VLLLYSGPALCSFHHSSTVQDAEAKPMIDVIAASVDRPAVLLVVGDTSCLDHDVLYVPPRQVTTDTQHREIDGSMGRRTDGRTDRQTDGWMDGKMGDSSMTMF